MAEQFRLAVQLLTAQGHLIEFKIFLLDSLHLHDVNGSRFQGSALLKVGDHLVEAFVRLVQDVQQSRGLHL